MFDRKHNCVVVVGAQWGDEGKGKIVDVLAERADMVVRYQGGANAGHTVVVGERQTVLHQIPSGILHPGTACVVGNGVVLDPETFFTEFDQLAEQGIAIAGRLFVSDRAHVVLPYHKLLDQASERQQQIGTTGRGIGPAYEDKIGRRGIRVADFCRGGDAREMLAPRVERANAMLAMMEGTGGASARADLDE
ncbi:MAG: adenylosuccinate synthetase, partial [Gemmatimonadales bacterium]